MTDPAGPLMGGAHERVAMFLDLSTCIGCRACQVACKEWNELPAETTIQRGSYQNPPRLTGDTWKQVKFIERPGAGGEPVWSFYSDSCKHCADAPCLAACPTGAIFRTERGMVLVNESVCNGNAHCASACPFDVIHVSQTSGVAAKCTFCEDRVGAGLEPACAKVCPTDCIQFGERAELAGRARARLDRLRSAGRDGAQLYGLDELGGLGVFYLLTDAPSVYGLPDRPTLPSARIASAFALAAAAAFCILAVTASWLSILA